MGSTLINLINNQLSQQLSILKETGFNGELQIISERGTIWRLYFYLGRLYWGEGGEANQRSWQRYINQYFPQLSGAAFLSLEQNSCECDRYLMLETYLQQKLINLQQLKGLIKAKIRELLFDIIQAETYHTLEFNTKSACCNSETLSAMSAKPFILLNPEEKIKKSQLFWSQWIEDGLGFWSRHSIVSFTDSSVCKSELPPDIVPLINGKNSLEDIAFLTNKNLGELARFLVEYVHEGQLRFIEPEVEQNLATAPVETVTNNNTSSQSPVIVAIDSNAEFSRSLARAAANNYQFINITDSSQAVARLTSYQPNLILLAANLPIVNSYEILSQLRRVPHLKDIPVILLDDSLAARLRSSLSGGVRVNVSPAVKPEVLLKIIQQLLSENSHRQPARAIKKYRGVVCNNGPKNLPFFYSQSLLANRPKKYRGIMYLPRAIKIKKDL